MTIEQELGELARDLTAMCEKYRTQNEAAKQKLLEMVNGCRAQHAESKLHTNQDIAIGAVCLAHRVGIISTDEFSAMADDVKSWPDTVQP
jgi:hypothetical protein